jgi:hypothetical protein
VVAHIAERTRVLEMTELSVLAQDDLILTEEEAAELAAFKNETAEVHEFSKGSDLTEEEVAELASFMNEAGEFDAEFAAEVSDAELTEDEAAELAAAELAALKDEASDGVNEMADVNAEDTELAEFRASQVQELSALTEEEKSELAAFRNWTAEMVTEFAEGTVELTKEEAAELAAFMNEKAEGAALKDDSSEGVNEMADVNAAEFRASQVQELSGLTKKEKAELAAFRNWTAEMVTEFAEGTVELTKEEAAELAAFMNEKAEGTVDVTDGTEVAADLTEEEAAELAAFHAETAEVAAKDTKFDTELKEEEVISAATSLEEERQVEAPGLTEEGAPELASSRDAIAQPASGVADLTDEEARELAAFRSDALSAVDAHESMESTADLTEEEAAMLASLRADTRADDSEQTQEEPAELAAFHNTRDGAADFEEEQAEMLREDSGGEGRVLIEEEAVELAAFYAETAEVASKVATVAEVAEIADAELTEDEAAELAAAKLAVLQEETDDGKKETTGVTAEATDDSSEEEAEGLAAFHGDASSLEPTVEATEGADGMMDEERAELLALKENKGEEDSEYSEDEAGEAVDLPEVAEVAADVSKKKGAELTARGDNASPELAVIAEVPLTKEEARELEALKVETATAVLEASDSPRLPRSSRPGTLSMEQTGERESRPTTTRQLTSSSSRPTPKATTPSLHDRPVHEFSSGQHWYHSEHSRADFLRHRTEGGVAVQSYTTNQDAGLAGLAHKLADTSTSAAPSDFDKKKGSTFQSSFTLAERFRGDTTIGPGPVYMAPFSVHSDLDNHHGIILRDDIVEHSRAEWLALVTVGGLSPATHMSKHCALRAGISNLISEPYRRIAPPLHAQSMPRENRFRGHQSIGYHY